jgi:hypothetical protein
MVMLRSYVKQAYFRQEEEKKPTVRHLQTPDNLQAQEPDRR